MTFKETSTMYSYIDCIPVFSIPLFHERKTTNVRNFSMCRDGCHGKEHRQLFQIPLTLEGYLKKEGRAFDV